MYPRGGVENIRDVLKINFKEIDDLWKNGCNILYCDLDVVFLKEAKYVGDFDTFAMFNFTDPPQTDVKFEKFFNCGIRYYPNNMDSQIWDLGIEMLENWNSHRWDCEQVIYNSMMWNQNDLVLEKIYRPAVSFQMLFTPPLHPKNSKFNNMPVTDASAVHVHGSRNSKSRLQKMLKGNFKGRVKDFCTFLSFPWSR